MNWFLENGKPLKVGGKMATAAECCCTPNIPPGCAVCEFTDPTELRHWEVTLTGWDGIEFSNGVFIVKRLAGQPICEKAVNVPWPSSTSSIFVDTNAESEPPAGSAGQIVISSRFGHEAYIALDALDWDYCNNLEEHCYEAPDIVFSAFYTPTGNEKVCIKAA